MSSVRAVDSPLYRAGVGLHHTITSPLISGSLLAALYALPDSSRQSALQRLPFTLSWATLKTVLLASLGLGLIRHVNRGLNSMAQNAWRITPAKGWDWPNEVAVVTGGCSGIGAEVVKQFIARGIHVAIFDLQDLPESLQGNPFVKLYKGDIRSPEFIAQAASQIESDMGEPSILVNNAGLATAEPLMETTQENLHRIIDVNVLSHWTTVQQFVPSMIKKNKGHVVNVASVISFVNLEKSAHYAASKAAALAFHESLAQELRSIHRVDSVLTTVVHPTFVETPLIAQAAPYLKQTGLILITPEEVGKAIADQIFARRGAQLIIPRRASGIALFRSLPHWVQQIVNDSFRGDWSRRQLPPKGV